MAGALSVDVFNSGYKPIPGGPGWDDTTPATWPATTSTLISGARDAVLVDALMTTSEGERLAAWVQETGTPLRAIFVTHGHADHFFGAGPVLEAFPETSPAPVATPTVSPGSADPCPPTARTTPLPCWSTPPLACCGAGSPPTCPASRA